MIKRIFHILIVFFILVTILHGQQDDSIKTKKQEMPKLEIPEITIIGKKAISLPFARKGEIYDIEIYKASGPDKSLLGERFSTALPSGSFPMYEERRRPLRVAIDGHLGSFSAAMFQTFFDYNVLKWGLSGIAKYDRTSGHVQNADASDMMIDINSYSLITTDNDILKTMRLSGGLVFSQKNYGLFGIINEDTERSLNQTGINLVLGSIKREGISADIGLKSNILTMSDKVGDNSFNIFAFTPTLNASLGADFSNIRLTSDLFYKSVSTNNHKDQLLSLINLKHRMEGEKCFFLIEIFILPIMLLIL